QPAPARIRRGRRGGGGERPCDTRGDRPGGGGGERGAGPPAARVGGRARVPAGQRGRLPPAPARTAEPSVGQPGDLVPAAPREPGRRPATTPRRPSGPASGGSGPRGRSAPR